MSTKKEIDYKASNQAKNQILEKINRAVNLRMDHDERVMVDNGVAKNFDYLIEYHDNLKEQLKALEEKVEKQEKQLEGFARTDKLQKQMIEEQKEKIADLYKIGAALKSIVDITI